MQGYQYSAMHRKQCIIYINQMFIGLQGPNFGHLRKFPGTYIMRLGYIYIYICQNCNFGAEMAKFWVFQNFPSTNIMLFFQKKTINLVSIVKNMKIYSSVWEK